MPNASVDRAREASEKARAGNKKAGKELIRLCREGMLVPDWEKEPVIDAKKIELHLQRRTEIGKVKRKMD